MAYIYLLNLHEIIDKKLNVLKKGIDNVSDEPEKIKFLEGRIKALSDFKEFLTRNLNGKLPRRIRQKLSRKI